MSIILLQNTWKSVKSQELGDIDRRAESSENFNYVSLQDSGLCSILPNQANTWKRARQNFPLRTNGGKPRH